MKRLWLLPISCCLIHMLTTGAIRSNGVIFVALQEEQDLGRLKASVPFALNGLAPIITAPLLGFLGSRMTFLAKAVCGLFLYCSQAICFFSTNVYFVMVFFGLVKNCGIVVLALSMQELILTSFQEQKATATGVAGLGFPLGGIFWPYLIHFFLEEYGSRGTFLLNAGVTLHCLIAITVIWTYERRRAQKHNDNQRYEMKGENKNVGVDLKRIDYSEKNSGMMTTNDTFPRTEDLQNNCSETAPLNIFENNFNNRKEKESIILTPAMEAMPSCLTKENPSKSKEEVIVTDQPPTSTLKVLINVITTRVFYFITFTKITSELAQSSVIQVTVDYLMDKEIQKMSAISMLTIFAVGGMCGRVGLGWIVDKKLLSHDVMIAIMLSLTASALITVTLISNLYCLQACFLVLGICNASSQIVNNVKYSLYFQKHETLMALSTSTFLQGFIQLCRFPLLGYLRDVSGTYDYFFLCISIILYALSLLWILESILESRNTRNYQKISTEETDIKEHGKA